MNDTPDNISSELLPQSAAPSITGLIEEFVVRNGLYYVHQFERLEDAQTFAWTFNWAAALLGPLWMAGRNLWGLFWVFILAELVALVQVGRGLWGNLGAGEAARSEKLANLAAQRLIEAQDAAAAGAENAGNLAKAAEYMLQNAEQARLAAEAAASMGPWLLVIGVILLLIVKGIEGVLANWTLERRFMRWRSDRSLKSGISAI